MEQTPIDPPRQGGEPLAPPPSRHGWSLKTKLILTGVLLTPIVLFSVYTCSALTVSYSDGLRGGILQKFSHKGWICKTWEGELAMTTIPGVAPTIWEFSVRDDRVAQRMNDAVSKRVVLHYKEHHGVPTTCFGMTNYYVDSVRVEP